MKVLLHNMPPLVRDIVAAAICQQPDMEIIDAASIDVPPILRNAPDVAVVGTDGLEETIDPVELLLRWPRSRIVVMPISGANAVMWALHPERTTLEEMSPKRLIDVIRLAHEQRAE
jgi:DNA-binding NarL/FixJ family response regulator